MEDFSNIINWDAVQTQSDSFKNQTPFHFAFIEEFFKREFYEKPTAMRKRKIDAATKRHKRKVSMTVIRKKPPYKKF